MPQASSAIIPCKKCNICAVTQAIDSLQRRSDRRRGQKQKIRSERAVGKKRRNGQRLQGQQHLRRTADARPFSIASALRPMSTMSACVST